jgi:lipid A 4'-phosphatase
MNRTGLVVALTIAVVVGVVFALFPQLDLSIAALTRPPTNSAAGETTGSNMRAMRRLY